jgi:4-hydroxyphenylpyruvate dioxygenase-like putative hemolysin
MEKYSNPIGTDGFAFVEFVSKDKSQIANCFKNLGLTEIGIGKNHPVSLYQQSQIRFFINECADRATASIRGGCVAPAAHATHRAPAPVGTRK